MDQTARWLMLCALTAAALGCGAPQEAPATEETPAAKMVARVGDRVFTMDDLDAEAMLIDVKPYQAIYDTRKRALAIMLGDHLLETEAAERGITRDELVDLEINQKMVRPTSEQIRTFYEQNQKQMRGRSVEEMSSEISNLLNRENRDRLGQDLLNSLRQKSPVEVALKPPRVPVTIAENDPTKGPAGAPVQLVEFSDFQ